jgi:hypothetical protein
MVVTNWREAWCAAKTPAGRSLAARRQIARIHAVFYRDGQAMQRAEPLTGLTPAVTCARGHQHLLGAQGNEGVEARTCLALLQQSART